MNNQKRETRNLIIQLITAVLFVICSLFMFNFYKSLSGFIANGFREPLVMIPIFSSYLLPVFAFLFCFYDFYVKETKRVAKIIYLSVASAWAVVNLVLIFSSLGVYVSNNGLGVYDTLYGIFFKFPYDAIIVNLLLVAMQVLRVIRLAQPQGKLADTWQSYKQYGIFKLSLAEYLLLSLLAILVFVFTGDFFGSFNAIENAQYDPKYLYLILWVLVVPLGNLLCLAYKPEQREIKKGYKIGILSLAIGINLLFGLLLLIFELTSPDFIAHVGKPLFLITFSVSLPIEMLMILSIGLISIIIYTVRLTRVIRQGKHAMNCNNVA